MYRVLRRVEQMTTAWMEWRRGLWWIYRRHDLQVELWHKMKISTYVYWRWRRESPVEDTVWAEARTHWERCLDEPCADPQHLASATGVLPSSMPPKASDYPSQINTPLQPPTQPHTTHTHIHQEILLKLLGEESWAYLGGACQAHGCPREAGRSLYWDVLCGSCFLRHLLQTPVSLKIILLLPAHPKKLQVCPVLSLF